MRINYGCFDELNPLSEELSTSLRHSSIFITGATGFFGKWILNTLAIANDRYAADITITCLSRNSEEFIKSYPRLGNEKYVSFIQGDIRTFDLPNDNFDYIIHAATPSTGQIQNDDLHSTIVDGTSRVLKVRAKKILYISSGGVYGAQPDTITIFSEDLQPNPQNIYGKAKLEAEKLCLQSNIPTVIVRPFSFLGPYLPLDAHFAAGNFINDALHGRKIIINSDGTSLRSYMYPTDMLAWLFKSLIYGQDGDIFNIGSDQPVSILQLAKTINESIGINTDNIVVKDKIIPNATQLSYVPCIDRIKSALGVDINISLEDAIHKTITFYKKK